LPILATPTRSKGNRTGNNTTKTGKRETKSEI
jgi:hypothetical protein